MQNTHPTYMLDIAGQIVRSRNVLFLLYAGILSTALMLTKRHFLPTLFETIERDTKGFSAESLNKLYISRLIKQRVGPFPYLSTGQGRVKTK